MIGPIRELDDLVFDPRHVIGRNGVAAGPRIEDCIIGHLSFPYVPTPIKVRSGTSTTPPAEPPAKPRFITHRSTYASVKIATKPSAAAPVVTRFKARFVAPVSR